MEFRILGELAVRDGTRSLALPLGRGRALLALLVLHAGEAVSAERLIDELWGEHPPATASTVVQGFVSRLRKVLEPRRRKGVPPSILRTVATGYLLAIDPDAVDANRFKRLVDEARGAPLGMRSAMLADALRLWHGPALVDFTYEPFAQPAITALEELRLAAIEDRIDTDLALGRSGEVVAELEELTSMYPFRERLRGHLMLALYRAGRQAEALEAYQDARATLVEELGIEPGPALREIQRAVLRQDPSLTLRPRAEPRAKGRGGEPAPKHWLPRERRVVTVIVADLAPSAVRGADPEALGRIGERSLDVATDVLLRHGARVEGAVGDKLMGFFGLPVAHEDDAVRAVRAAVELRAAVEAFNEDVQRAGIRFAMRAGIESGEVVVGGTGGLLRAAASGQVLTTASRLQEAAAQEDVIVGAGTHRLIRGAAVMKAAGDIALEGSDGTVSTWRVLDVVSGAPAVARHLDAPICGRQAELTRLRTAFRRTVRSGTAFRFTVLGEAGIGKSRLAKEFVEWIGSDARVITGRCPAYGEGITFLPLREAVLQAAGLGGWPALSELLESADDALNVNDQIAGLIGLTPQQGRPDELFPAVGRLFEVLANPQPLVVVFEDLHWAEPTLLDLVEYLGRRLTGRVFLLCLARSELIEEHPDWAATGPNTDTLVLEPLSPSEVDELIVDRAGPTLPAGTLGQIAETARGNPLFAEQLLAALQDDGVDVIPASLRSLLAMRLDRLGPGERDLLRCAAIVGIDSDEDALAALLPDEASPFVDRHVQSLERRQLIARGEGGAVRFRHVLIQFAAYQSMTREDRARLHERFADWLETGASTSPPELDEIVGYHLEQAVEHRRAGGVIEGTESALAARGGECLARAADRALERGDWTAAENLLSRARVLLPSDDPRRPVVTQRLAEVSLVLGRHTHAQGLLLELVESARAQGEHARERSARLEHGRIQLIVGPDPVPLASIRQVADEAIRSCADANDDAGQARASFLLACVLMRVGEITAAEEAFQTSLTYADGAGDIREELANRWMLAEAMVLGPTPLPSGIERCEELATTRGMKHPGVHTLLAVLYAMVGRFDEARGLNERARRTFLERMRVRRLVMFVAQSSATVELLAGDILAAERELRSALAFARELEERDSLSQAAARLSLVLRMQGRSEEGADLAVLSEQAAPSESVAAQALSRAAVARSASDAGEHQEAESLARQAVRLVPREMLNLRADVLVELAEVLRAAGQENGATEALKAAVRLYKRKGNRVLSERVAQAVAKRMTPGP